MTKNRTRAFITSILFVAIFFGSAAIAAAGVAGGRAGGVNSNGTYARVLGNSFTPSSGTCILFSTLVNNETTNAAQLQAGLVRCLNTSGLFFSCNHVKFVEALYGSGGYCQPKGSFSNGVYHNFKVERIGATDYWQAYVNGNPEETLQGFPLAHNNRIWAWGEWTGAGTCSGWGGSGLINDWKKKDPVNGWVNLSGTIAGSCWFVGNINSGTFNVTH